MFKGRIWPFIAAAIVLVLLFLVCRATSLFKTGGSQSSTLPVDLQNVIPSSWILLPDQPEICDYDGDGESEWLILFRYDTTQVQVPYQSAGTTVQEGPIGGVIYDAQVNYVPQEPGNRSPYRPALLIPYMLLPDFFAGKGQGYLGESSVKLAQYPAANTKNGQCATTELYVLGYAGGSLPARLSAFRWRGKATGYAVAHFVGNARIAADLSTDNSKPLSQITTFDRLDNHRSLLCEVKHFVRQGEAADLSFPEDPNAYTIDFCFNAPDDPYYPEGVVVAMLRGNTPENTQNMPEPMGKTYLMAGVTLPPELGNPSESPVRILSVVNQGAVETRAEQGKPCPEQSTPTQSSTIWWCGSEEAEVLTEVVLGQGQTQRVLWKLISVANDQINADTHWRISEIRLL
jgi:hypothetical protein